VSFEWKSEYSIGVFIIDEQHKVLVQLLNDLGGLRSENSKNPESKSSILQRLDAYTKVHFITEEELMRIYGFEDLENHRKLHAKFSEKVESFCNFYHDDKMFLFDNVFNYLEGWLIKHIQGEDKKLGPYLNSKGLK
jgi:hemerythrin-like metal-binding protein